MYLLTDSLGSVRGVVNSSGTLAATTSYDAWGNPETTGGLSLSTPFGYAGGYTDPTGLVYLINRYYDPAAGQFTSVDPLLIQTQEAYGYGNGDPVNNTDPAGEATSRGCAHGIRFGWSATVYSLYLPYCVAYDVPAALATLAGMYSGGISFLIYISIIPASWAASAVIAGAIAAFAGAVFIDAAWCNDWDGAPRGIVMHFHLRYLFAPSFGCWW
jgi:RHS repeat-associated protein